MVLRSLAHQQDGPAYEAPAYEVVVADDGSGPETAALIRRLQADYPVPLLHAWQPDAGFRLARSRNNALLAATGDYVIFMDGDCLAPADFIATHGRLAQAGHFVAGARCYIKRRRSAAMMGAAQPGRTIGRTAWFLRALFAQANRPFQLLALPGNWGRYRHLHRWQGVQTCNLAVWRRDIDRVEGFDNTYIGHGFEDSDFALRLLRAGLLRKSGRFASVVLHLWHPRPGVAVSPNAGRFDSLLACDRFTPVSGLSHLATEQPDRAAG